MKMRLGILGILGILGRLGKLIDYKIYDDIS